MNKPHPADVQDARGWLLAGAPAAARGHDAKAAVRILLDVLAALPRLDPVYAYGTEEHKAAMRERLKQEQARDLGPNCPRCGRHDYALWAGQPEMLRDEWAPRCATAGCPLNRGEST